MPKREVVDCIPDLLKEELARVFKELGSNFFSINTLLNALGEEVEQLSRITSCIRIMQKLRDELELYREHAKIEMSKPVLNRKDLWTFWTFNALILPNYFAVASTVALISPSSAVCGRLFARLVMGFGDDQENALQDYKSASTIMRYNNCLMKSSGLVPY